VAPEAYRGHVADTNVVEVEMDKETWHQLGLLCLDQKNRKIITDSGTKPFALFYNADASAMLI
jgi:hypothetical protein